MWESFGRNKKNIRKAILGEWREHAKMQIIYSACFQSVFGNHIITTNTLIFLENAMPFIIQSLIKEQCLRETEVSRSFYLIGCASGASCVRKELRTENGGNIQLGLSPPFFAKAYSIT